MIRVIPYHFFEVIITMTDKLDSKKIKKEIHDLHDKYYGGRKRAKK